ncbi:MAG: BlaI/MecI/CopY family transcriptional regulator [Bacteroidota bacterium]
MEKLAKREEQIMRAFWKLKKAFIKEVIEEIPDPKPHYNSVATMVRILEEKGFLAHVAYGKGS